MKRVAVIGAGPTGLEAALAAAEQGYAVEVFERGRAGEAVRQWGGVRMFSPFRMNATAAGQARLRARGYALPEPEALLMGREFAERYLQPLAECLPAQVHLGTEVLSVARAGALKTEGIGEPERGQAPFRLLVSNGEERYASADLVWDCAGTYATPNPLGAAGQWALGERAAAGRLHYGPEVDESFAGLRTLVAGGGHSAATAVRRLAELPGTEVRWVRRKEGRVPCARVAADPLPARDELAVAVNELVARGRVQVLAGTTVEAIAPDGAGWRVSLAGQGTVEADRVVCATGFRPDLTLARELHAQTCWATEGTYPLAASLLGEAGGDCLAVPAFGADTLRHPEPGYFALGMKSYGRSPDFLLQTGHAQIAALLEALKAAGS